MEESSVDSSKSTLTLIAKIIGIIAIISSIFGVSYQKGMIVRMQLGNLNGNYDVREVINSAIFGYLELYDKASEISFFYLVSANWEVSIAFLVIGLSIPYLYKRRHNLDEFRENTKLRVRTIVNKVADSYIWSPLVCATIGFFANLAISIISYSLLILSGILLLPALIGYILGANKVDTIMDNPPCNDITNEVLEKKYLRQCTQLKINGETITGNILLENNEAYFLHLNNSFLYLKKDGKICISSKFQLTEDIDDVEKFEFEKDKTDDLCNTIETN